MLSDSGAVIGVVVGVIVGLLLLLLILLVVIRRRQQAKAAPAPLLLTNTSSASIAAGAVNAEYAGPGNSLSNPMYGMMPGGESSYATVQPVTGATYAGAGQSRDGGYMSVTRPAQAGAASNPLYDMSQTGGNYGDVSSKAAVAAKLGQDTRNFSIEKGRLRLASVARVNPLGEPIDDDADAFDNPMYNSGVTSGKSPIYDEAQAGESNTDGYLTIVDASGKPIRKGEYATASEARGVAQYDAAGPSRGAAQYDSASPSRGAAQYDAAGPSRGAAQYDAAGPSRGAAQYDTAGPSHSAHQYDSAGPSRHTVYDQAAPGSAAPVYDNQMGGMC